VALERRVPLRMGPTRSRGGRPGSVRPRHSAQGADLLADLGLEAGVIEAVGETVSAAPSSNPQTFTQQDLDYLLGQAYIGDRPEESSS
jgi:hypothetical protein